MYGHAPPPMESRWPFQLIGKVHRSIHWKGHLDSMGGGAWPSLVGGVICLVNTERDLNLLKGSCCSCFAFCLYCLCLPFLLWSIAPLPFLLWSKAPLLPSRCNMASVKKKVIILFTFLFLPPTTLKINFARSSSFSLFSFFHRRHSKLISQVLWWNTRLHSGIYRLHQRQENGCELMFLY
jgi:hypothetical protein